MADPRIRGIVLNLVSKNRDTVYGQQATNKFLPEHLRRETKDFDILTSKPESSAKELIEKLNRKFGADKFEVVPAIHKGTFKVKNKETGEVIADYTKVTTQPRSYNEVGVKYARLKYSEGKLKKMLRDEMSSFRHDKDFEMLRRIRKSRGENV